MGWFARLGPREKPWQLAAIEAGERIYFVPAGHGAADGHMRALLEYALTHRDGPGCFYCGYQQEARPTRLMAIDHVRARRRGGSDEVDNLVWACNHCNLLKGDVPAWFFAFWLAAREAA